MKIFVILIVSDPTFNQLKKKVIITLLIAYKKLWDMKNNYVIGLSKPVKNQRLIYYNSNSNNPECDSY